MVAEILVNDAPQETRVALVEGGVLQEIHIERPNISSIVGNIYKGKVARILPGMQAAFVDIGLERSGFLHVSDIMPLAREEGEELDMTHKSAEIRSWLRAGEEVLVQVIKDPLGSKGARLTTHLSIASRHLVYIPDLSHIGVSLRLQDETERERLLTIMQELTQADQPAGYIIRTAAEGVTVETLKAEVEFLQKLWRSVQKKAKKAKAYDSVYQDLPLVKRVIRDMVNQNIGTIRVDTKLAHDTLKEFGNQFFPLLKAKLHLHTEDGHIFDLYGIEDELQLTFKREVKLKSGGYLVIDQTEAMTTIDINTGGFVGSRNLEETIFKTNLEAAHAIGRQLRLRNLGGMIIIDFIDMLSEEHRQQLHDTFAKAMERDPAKTNISEISELGLVQMTRKRTHESLTKMLCEPCPNCQGRGIIKTIETTCYEIFREISREALVYPRSKGFMILAAPVVVDYLLEELSEALAELESKLEQPIKQQVELSYHREQFDIALL